MTGWQLVDWDDTTITDVIDSISNTIAGLRINAAMLAQYKIYGYEAFTDRMNAQAERLERAREDLQHARTTRDDLRKPELPPG